MWVSDAIYAENYPGETCDVGVRCHLCPKYPVVWVYNATNDRMHPAVRVHKAINNPKHPGTASSEGITCYLCCEIPGRHM